MRRKKKKHWFIILIFIFILSLSVSYAMVSTNINIYGKVSGNFNDNMIVDKDSNPDLKIDDISHNSWKEGDEYKFQIKFILKNIGSENFDNYKLTLTFNDNILSISTWGFEHEINNNNLILKSNNILAPNQEIEINFIVGIKKDHIKITKIKLESDTTSNEIDNSLFLVDFSLGNGWGNYTYQYNVTVTNNTGKQITYWQITIDLPENTSYLGGWNAIFNTNNNMLVIKNDNSNGKLNHNQSTSFGLQLNTNIQNFIPTNYSVMVR